MIRLLITVLILTEPAWAADQCGPMDDMLKQLSVKFQEVPVYTAEAGPGVSVTITTSPTGTWTFIATHEGAGCIIVAGDKWAVAPAPPAIIKPSVPTLEEHGLILIEN